MKDKRLDVLLEHLTKGIIRRCKHCVKDQGCEWCMKMVEDGFPKRIDCGGDISKCELEG